MYILISFCKLKALIDKKGSWSFLQQMFSLLPILTERLKLSVSTIKKNGDRYKNQKLFWDQWYVCMGNRISVHLIRTHQPQLVNCFVHPERSQHNLQRSIFSTNYFTKQRLVYIEQKILLLTSVAGLPIIRLTKLQFRRSVKKNISCCR